MVMLMVMPMGMTMASAGCRAGTVALCGPCRRRATFTVHPATIAVLVKLLFPYGNAVFYFIDNVAACGEGFATMRSADAHPHGKPANFQQASAVDATGGLQAKTLARFFEDAAALAVRQHGVGLVGQAYHAPSFVRLAYPAFECYIAAGTGVAQCGLLGRHIDGLIADAEAERAASVR